jgi:hypothetical protein
MRSKALSSTAVGPDLQTEFRVGTSSPPGPGSSLDLSLRDWTAGRSGLWRLFAQSFHCIERCARLNSIKCHQETLTAGSMSRAAPACTLHQSHAASGITSHPIPGCFLTDLSSASICARRPASEQSLSSSCFLRSTCFISSVAQPGRSSAGRGHSRWSLVR